MQGTQYQTVKQHFLSYCNFYWLGPDCVVERSYISYTGSAKGDSASTSHALVSKGKLFHWLLPGAQDLSADQGSLGMSQTSYSCNSDC